MGCTDAELCEVDAGLLGDTVLDALGPGVDDVPAAVAVALDLQGACTPPFLAIFVLVATTPILPISPFDE